MRAVDLRVTLFLPAAALFAALTVAVPAQQPSPFRSGANTVAIYATVTDREGRLVPDLTLEDFEVRDSGKPQPITVFSNEVQAITVVMMLDRSGSMKANFRLVEAAAESFVRRLYGEDKARIGSFSHRIQVDPDGFTRDHHEMTRILRSELQPEGPTPLWNAVNVAMTALSGEDGRRVVLVFTDGVDSPMNFKFNNVSLPDAVKRAQRENVMIYAIGLESVVPFGNRRAPVTVGPRVGWFETGRMVTQRPDPGLPKIAEETGGGYFELKSTDDLASTFARVADELHRQYVIGFEPSKLDGKTHKLEVRIRKPGMTARARKSYIASPSTTDSKLPTPK
ncbi:MAG TPA: VWA domain-containing protein [Vicinamibacterales bacterium]|nr:VWA domain-containing protein [Vicinamibacterales bacterium]